MSKIKKETKTAPVTETRQSRQAVRRAKFTADLIDDKSSSTQHEDVKNRKGKVKTHRSNDRRK